MAQTGFGKYLFIMAFSGSMVVMGMNELHSMYSSGKLSPEGGAESSLSPRSYVEIFYGSSKVEGGAFGRKYVISSKIEPKRLNDKDKSDIKRLVKKVLR